MYSSTGIDATNLTGKIDMAFLTMFGVTIFFLISLTALMIYFIIRYNRKRNPVATQIEGNTKLEIIWTVIPLILVLVLFYFGWAGWKPMKTPPEGARRVTSIARMWSFSFKYENGKISDKLVLPVNEPVILDLESVDVIHSLYIPAFKLKEDMVPGIETKMWFSPNAVGKYHIFCAEYCGLRHSYMESSVEVLSVEDFEKWYSDTTATVSTGLANADMPGAEGFSILQNQGCNACHSSDGSRLVGPSYLGVWGEEQVVIENGTEKTVTVDENYIKRSIYQPNTQIVKGYQKGLMQSYEGVVSEEDIGKIIEYIKSLKE